MSRRPLVLALAFALLPVSGVHAEDLLQTYELARSGDPQLSAAESSRLFTREGAVQARAALLPQIDGRVKSSAAIWLDLSLKTGAPPLEGEKFQAGEAEPAGHDHPACRRSR